MGADVGLHFFNPVAVLPLVEIVRHDETSDEALATAWDVCKKLRKRGVVVQDAPGFVVNRVLTRMTSVLMDSLEHGNTVAETDEAVVSLGMPMAPSVLLQMVGPRVANHVLVTMHDAYPERFPLSPTLANYAAGNEEIVLAGDRRRSRRGDPGRRPGGDRRRDPPPARRGRRRRARRTSTPACCSAPAGRSSSAGSRSTWNSAATRSLRRACGRARRSSPRRGPSRTPRPPGRGRPPPCAAHAPDPRRAR